MSSSQDHPGVSAPPPLIFLTYLAVAWLFQQVAPLPIDFPARKALAALVGGLSLPLLGGAIFRFRSAGTPARPWKTPTAFVAAGPYRWTRNPMYLGMLSLYVALGTWLGSLHPFILILPLISTINLGVIEREERYLAGKFGDSYRDYLLKVARWI